MPTFRFSHEHDAFVKRCSTCDELTIGVKEQERSVFLFTRYFSFNKLSADGFNQRCKKCHAAKVRLNHLKRNYNLTQEELDTLWVEQNGLCGICSTSLVRISHTSNSVCVDHIEDTTIVVGLLCVHCNAAIGLLKHKPENFTKARDWCGRRVILLSNQERKVG